MDLVSISDGIKNVDFDREFLELPDEIDNFRVANVGAILFERQSKNHDARSGNFEFFLKHRSDNVESYPCGHSVVDAATNQNHLDCTTSRSHCLS